MKKILVVDDDNNMNDFVSRVLASKLRCNVTSVKNGIDGLAALNQNTFDLLVMDFYMPVLTGLETLSIIRSDPRFVELPVVMMTSNRNKENIEALIKLRITDYLIKPFTIDFAHKKFGDILAKIDNYKIPAGVNKNLSFNSKLFLIAESNGTLRKNIAEKFGEKYETIECDSGIESLKNFLSKKPGLVYLGHDLPIISEFILGRIIKNFDLNKELKIIITKAEEKLTAEERSIYFSAVKTTENSAEIIEKLENILK